MKVTRPLFVIGDRRYIGLDGQNVKVPWRYNRVMCTVHGIVPIQELKVGQEVLCRIEYTGEWPVLKEIWTDE